MTQTNFVSHYSIIQTMTSDANKEYAVNWKNHMNHVKKAFDDLLSSEELTDVTLCCEGKKIGAHKVLLSACSDYFRDIFKQVPCQHPVIFLKGVEYIVLTDILRFMYSGEVSVDKSNLNLFLQTAQLLQVNGLTDKTQEPKKEDEDCEATSALDEVCRSKNKAVKRKVPKKVIELPEKKAKEENQDEFLPNVKDEVHLIEHFDETVNDPDKCDDEFMNLSEVQSMLKQENKNKCKIQFKEKSGMSYQCDICGKIYRLKDSLYKHSSVHTGNTRCTICSKVLSRKTHLGRHMQTNHGIYFRND